jgi:hypothetical protein
LAGVFFARTAFAKIIGNTIDPVANVSHHGRHLILTGPLACTEGERSLLRVTVTQPSTGAIAEGIALITCTGETNQWTLRATTRGRAAFEEGPATATALAQTFVRGVTTDAHQWLVNVTLV